MFNNFFFFENRTVYVVKWKNIVQPDRPQMTIGRMRIACWITNATDTHSKYVILEIKRNANLMQLGNFIDVFLVRHVSGSYAHHQEH
jgi:hypothetical protein